MVFGCTSASRSSPAAKYVMSIFMRLSTASSNSRIGPYTQSEISAWSPAEHNAIMTIVIADSPDDAR
ncbi:hypothetical protein D3C81_2244490 [compost metagenome]